MTLKGFQYEISKDMNMVWIIRPESTWVKLERGPISCPMSTPSYETDRTASAELRLEFREDF